MKIKMLNHETINKIAAGEVIIRPVSVIKELVENAIDADSKRITVAVEKGGKTAIRVMDDGIGIAYNEVPLAFKRHATSKILTIDDLENIGTLGFRGEALSSIAAVARVRITTRAREEEIGSETIFEGSTLVNQRVCTYDRGTEILVTDLFYNTPARQKHLQKEKNEERQVRDVMEKLALSHPEIAFTYLSEGKEIFRTLGTGALKDVIESLYGREFFRGLRPLDSENAPMRLTGYISDLTLTRATRDHQIFFINQRYVKNRGLSKAFEEAYAGYMMQHKHPVGIVFMELPGRMLDVNIHPAKTEIQILNESLVNILFRQGIREALKAESLVVDLAQVTPDSERAEKEAGPTETPMSFFEDRDGFQTIRDFNEDYGETAETSEAFGMKETENVLIKQKTETPMSFFEDRDGFQTIRDFNEDYGETAETSEAFGMKETENVLIKQKNPETAGKKGPEETKNVLLRQDGINKTENVLLKPSRDVKTESFGAQDGLNQTENVLIKQKIPETAGEKGPEETKNVLLRQDGTNKTENVLLRPSGDVKTENVLIKQKIPETAGEKGPEETKNVLLRQDGTNKTENVLLRPSGDVKTESFGAQEGLNQTENVLIKQSEEPLKTMDRPVRKPDFDHVKIIGQLFSTYILLERGDEVLLLDQHAAHEAFLYEELRQRFERKLGFPAQSLMVPQTLEISAKEARDFEEIREDLLHYGFECDLFGETTLMVRSVPVILGEPQDVSLLQAFMESRLYEDVPDPKGQIERIITMSCKKAVKGHQKLSHEEIRTLLEGLSRLDNPYTCPHGRPIILKLREYELKKLFKRVV